MPLVVPVGQKENDNDVGDLRQCTESRSPLCTVVPVVRIEGLPESLLLYVTYDQSRL